ncbi:ATP-binding protein [Pleionea sp. CnH1-48]|uniref:sensor histidine kinase n=1 Tax=Pleionea sp. CnH1-48 TaxID=2954494 RepID=UPI0020970C9A|nr:ATP-binding protein [Pleionea sp. CnH1-48]MCO7223202.1 ATP-binding protein [Pleionea sp. CnH1-48]
MTSINKSKLKGDNHYWLLPIIMGSVFFLFLILSEYWQGREQLNNNKVLLVDSVRKNISLDISRLQHLYFSFDTQKVFESWKNIKPDFYIIEKGLQIFPFPLQVQEESSWKKHADIFEGKSEPLDELTRERIGIIEQLANSLKQNDETVLRQAFLRYQWHKESFRLLPLSEMLSDLKVIAIAEEQSKPLSRQIVRLMLLDGFERNTHRVASFIELLLQSHSNLSKQDILQAYKTLSKVAENYNIELGLYSKYYDKLWETIPQNPVVEEDIHILTPDGYLAYQEGQTQWLVPYPIEVRLTRIIDDMKQRGVLRGGDKVIISNLIDPTAVDNLSIHLNSPEWQRSWYYLNIYLVGKLIMLAFLTGLMLWSVRQLKQRERQRLEQLTMREKFLNLVSHELKTPLASIRLMSETLQKRLNRGMDTKDYPERILKESDNLWFMVDNLLSFNRIKQGMVALDKENMSVKSLMQKVVSCFPDDSIYVDYQISHCLFIKADALMIELVLKNLLVNAIKYNQNPRAELILAYDENLSSLIVTDNGIGIDKNLWYQVFEDFYRVGQLNAGGSGLGLALSKAIMKLHHGDLSIRASSSKGTEWQLTLSEMWESNE